MWCVRNTCRESSCFGLARLVPIQRARNFGYCGKLYDYGVIIDEPVGCIDLPAPLPSQPLGRAAPLPLKNLAGFHPEIRQHRGGGANGIARTNGHFGGSGIYMYRL